jgi:hypothetical protein
LRRIGLQLFAFFRWKLKHILLVVFTLCISAVEVHAALPDSLGHRTRAQMLRDTMTTHHRTDILDICKIIIGLKKDPFHKTKVRESGPFYIAYVYPGYTQVTRATADGGFNMSFRPKKNSDGKLSFLYNYFEYTENKQFILVSLSTIYSNNNKWVFPGEFRYFNFPTTTYGLGSGTLPSQGFGIDYSHFRFYRNFLRRIVSNTFIGMGYNFDYYWNIADYNISKGLTDDFTRYGYSSTSLSSGPSVSFLYDTRDDPNQPYFGAYVNFQFIAHIQPLGSNSNWNSMVLDIRKFIPLTKKWYVDLCFWGLAWMTLNGHPPYLDLPSIGWDAFNNSGREYAAGRYTGADMLYFEAELRFDITANGLFGGVVFGNLETFTGASGAFFGPLQPGGGAGIRIMFNKNTRSNTCIDYGFGSHHSGGVATNLNDIF